jgi:hypothetical protein
MNSTPAGTLTFSQIARINRAIAMKNSRNSRNNCITHVGCSYTLAENKTLRIDFDTWIDRDIISEDGATLIVEEKLSMADKAKIIVKANGKLIVDGGIITSCGNKWEGIQVYGGLSGYDIEIINNSTIENTSKAAVSMFATGGWLLGDGNAQVLLDNSTFKNCKSMLAMGSRNPSFNRTKVNDCTHNQGKWSVTNWNCLGVEITNNTFNNVSDECIVTSSGQLKIEGNEFHSGLADVLFANVLPGFGSNLSFNEFYGNNTGVRSLGSSLGQHLIEKNQFLAGEFDVFMDGDNNYIIRNNDITADYGIVSVDNGLSSNEISYNDVNGSY